MGFVRSFRRQMSRQMKQREIAAEKRRCKVRFEPLEPRLLLSADLDTSGVAAALSDGLDRFGDRFQGLLEAETIDGADSLLDTRMPIILQTENEDEPTERSFSPTIGQLGSVPSPSGDFPDLTDLDGDGMVDLGEMVQSLLFYKVEEFLDNPTGSLTDFLKDLDVKISLGTDPLDPDTQVTFEVLSVTDNTDNTAGNEAELSFDADFLLTVSDDLLIDLGPKADDLGLKILRQPEYPEYNLRVDTSLGFGFTFGVRTAGQETIDEYDFFIRRPDDVVVSVTAGEVPPIVAESEAPLNYEDDDLIDDSFSVKVWLQDNTPPVLDFSKDVDVGDNVFFDDLASLVDYLNSELGSDSPVEFAAFGSDKLQLSPVYQDQGVTKISLTNAGFLGFSSDDIVATKPEANFDLNVGFLGTEVRQGTITIDAGVISRFIDPNDPSVLGFVEPFIDPLDGGVLAGPDGELTAAKAPAELALSDEDGAGFFLRIGRGGVATEVIVPQSATTDNTTLEHLRSDVQDALDAAGLGALITAGISNDKLTLSLPDTDGDLLGFNNAGTGEAFALDTDDDSDDGQVTLTASDWLITFEFNSDVSFFLSLDGALPYLVTIPATDPAIEDLGFAPQEDAVLVPLVAANPGPTDGRFDTSGDRSLTITVTNNTGATTEATLTIYESDPDGDDPLTGPLTGWDTNASLSDLVLDINQAIGGSTLSGKISASVDGAEIKLTPVAAITSVKVSGPHETEFGFADNQGTYLSLTTDADAAGSLSGEATFDVIIDPVPGSPYTVTVTVPDGTTGLANYVSAINADLSGTEIEAVADGNRITLKVKDTDGVASFEVKVPKVTKGNNTTLTDLVEDINRVLSDMEVGVIAGQSANAITLTLEGESLEITRTLTYDAVLTFAELDPANTSADELFEMESDPDSNITLDLPVIVKQGLKKPDSNPFDPDGVSIEASFDPFELDIDEDIVKRNDRLGLFLKQDATPDVQDITKLNLVNFEAADLINFTRMSANNVIGLFVQLQGMLDSLPQTDMFAKVDIPFARAALGQTLDFGDLFGDQILFDDNDTPDDKGDDIDKLLERENDTFFITFGTAQELSTQLQEINVFDGSPIYDPDIDELTYDLPELSDDFDEQAVPIDLSLDLAPLEGLGSESAVMLGADGGLKMILGFDLAARGRLEEDTPLSDLNNGRGVAIKPEPAVTGPGDARAVYGVLDEDVSFTVKINEGSEVTVVIKAADTVDNLTVEDLAKDIDAAMDDDKIDVTVQPVSDDADAQPRILFKASDSSVTSFVLSPQGSAGSRLGFGVGDGAVASIFGAADIIAPARLSEPAEFQLSVNNGTSKTVTVPSSDPWVETSSADDLVLAVNDAIVEAGFKVRAMRVGSRLALVAADSSVSTFTVNAVEDDPAVTELGLANDGPTPSDLIVLSNTISPVVGRLTGSATFTADVTTTDGGVVGTVTIQAEDTAENRTIFDLSQDVNFALAEAVSSGETIDLSRYLLAENDGGRLVLTARQPFLTTDPAPSLYRLSEDATFRLIITTTDGSGGTDTTSTEVIVNASDTTNIDSLVQSINVALQGQGLNSRVVADSIPVNDENGNPVGARITFTVDDPAITEVRLSTDADDPMAGELSFNTSQLAALSVISAGDVIPDAQLTNDATFGLDITTDDGEGGVSTTSATVTVAKTSTILSLIGATNAPVFYQLPDADATFELEITWKYEDNTEVTETVSVVVTKESTQGNRTLSDLVADVNAALDNAQVNTQIVAGNDGSHLTLRAVGEHVMSFKLTAADSPAVTVLGFGTGETEADDGTLVADNAVTPIVGRTTADAEFEIEITESGGTTTNATVSVTEADTGDNSIIEDLVDDLNAALNAAGVNGLVAAGHLGGRLTLSAVDGSQVTAFKVTAAADNPAVTELGLPADESATANGSIDDLVADVNSGLGTAQLADGTLIDLRGQVVAEQSGSRIMVRAVDGSVTGFQVNNTNSSAVNELGLPSAQTEAGLQLVATDSVVPVIGRLVSDATFNVELINHNGSIEQKTVTITSASDNAGLSDIAADINQALIVAGLGEKLSARLWNDRVELRLLDSTYSGFTVTAAGSAVADLGFAASMDATVVSGFTIDADANDPAVTELGLFDASLSRTAALADFVITIGDGESHPVSLARLLTSSAPTVDDLLETIDAQTYGDVQAEINDARDGFKLTDPETKNNTGAATDLFRVDTINASAVAFHLGIFGADISLIGEPPDGVIHGDTTSVEDISTRLFLRDATLDGTLSVTPGPELQGDGDPPEVDITGNFGFVGVRLTGQRDPADIEHAIDINGSFSSDFKVFDPDETGPIQPRLTLAELTDGVINDITSVLEYPDIVGSGTITLDVALNPAAEDGLFDELLPPGDRIVTITLEDFGKPYELAGPVPAAVSVDAPNLEDLEKFEKIRYGDVLAALDLVGEFLGAFETAGFLGENLFVIDKSISSLLSTADMYDRALSLAKGSDTQALQGLEQAFKDAFGLGEEEEEDAKFELNLVEDDGTDYLKFNMKYEAVLNKALGVNLDLTHDVKIGHLVPPNFQTGSVLKGVGKSKITLSFGIDLNEPERVVLFDDLDLSGSLAAFGGFTACGWLGGKPLQDGRSTACICFSVKDGSAVLRTAYDFGPKEDFGSLNADFAVLAEPDEDGNLTSEVFGEDGSLNTNLFEGGPKDIGTEVDVTLPIHYPNSENKNYIGNITATGNINSAEDLPVPRDLALSAPAELATLPFAKRGLFENAVLLVDLVDMALLGVQEALNTEVFNVELPLIGSRLSEGAQVIEDFRVGFVRDFRDGLASALNPSDNLIAELLFDGLGPNGANLLFDRVNADPMVINPYKDALGNSIPSDFELLGRLTSDVLFDLILNDEAPVTVELHVDDYTYGEKTYTGTHDNVSIDDLVEDLNNALEVADLDDRIEAIGLGRALGLRALSSKADFSDPDALSDLKIEENENNQGNLGDLGFQDGDTAFFVGTALTLTGTEVVTTEILSTTVFDESRLSFENLTSPGAFISMARFKDTNPDGSVAGDALKWRMRLGQTLPLGDTTDFDFDLGFPGLGLEADGALDVSLNWTFDFGFGLSEKEKVFLDLNPTSNILSRVNDPHFQAFLWVAPVSGSRLTGKLAGLQLDIVAQNPPGEVMVPNNLNATFGFNIINRKDSSAGRLGIADIGKFGISKPTISASTNLRLGLTLGLDSDLLGDTAAFFPEITSNFVFDWSLSRPQVKDATFSLLLMGDEDDVSQDAFVPTSISVTVKAKDLKDNRMAADFVDDLNKAMKTVSSPISAQVGGLTGNRIKLTALNEKVTSMEFFAEAKNPAVKAFGFVSNQLVKKNPGTKKGLSLVAKNPVVDQVNLVKDKTTAKSLLAEGLEKVQFNRVSLNLGAFLSDVVKPYLDEIQMITRPIQPIVNVLTTPIPVISDLAGRSIRMIDLAGAFGKVDPRFLSAIGRLITAINKVPSNPEDVKLNFGTFTIYPSTPDLDSRYLTDKNFVIGKSGLQNNQKNYDFDSKIKTTGTSSSSSTKSFANQLRGGKFGDFKLPILTDPSQVFNIILGKTADLIALDLPPLVLQFAYKQSFPIDGLPLAAFIRGTASATIDFAFGFDTYGILQAAKTDFRNPFLIGDGFYVNDLNPFGQDVPELRFGLSISAGAEISAAVASAGVEGGLFATVDFDLFDPNRDGKVRISEMWNTMDFQSRSDKAYLTPLSIFDVNGKVQARLFAFIEALFGAFRKEFNIVPPITIVDFEIPFDREPILAMELEDGVLQLNMGPNADQRLNGNTEDGAERFFVEQDGAGHVKVWAPDLGVDEGNAQKYEASSLIFAQGGKFNDVIDLSGVTDVDIRFEIEGDQGNDEIYIGTGPATVEGNTGNDIIEGGAGNDFIFGNEGNDTIKGNGGDDIIFGDDGNISDKIVSASIGDDGDDIIEGGTGMDLIFGGGGSDTLKGNDEADLVLGDGGRVMFENEEDTDDEDKLKLDLGNDNEIDLVAQVTGRGIEIDDESRVKVLGTEFGEGGTDIISGGAGPDILYGGAAGDDIFGQAGDDLIFGGKGFDTIRGGGGGDTVSGGSDSDTIFGFSDNPDDGDPAVDDGADVLFGDEGGDIIRGQGGGDTVRGGVGGDILFGDEGNDELFAGDGADILFGGPANDTLDSGSESDILFGDDGLVATLGENDADNDWFPRQPTVDADGTEILVDDEADGVRGNTINGVNPDGHENEVKDEDLLIGLGDPILLAGLVHDQDGKTQDLIVTAVALTDGDDLIIGDGDNDVLLGGNGNDRLGGDVDPRLDQVSPFTPAGEDVLIGDGGRIEFNDGYQTSIASIVGTFGDDVLYGDNGDDIGLGGGGEDQVFGGFGAVVYTDGTLGESRGRTDPAAGDKDVLFGDNGEVLFTTEFSTRVERNRDDTEDIYLDIKTGTVISEIRSTDTLNGTGGADIVEGGVDDDVIIGGVNGPTLTDRDTLRGGTGNDVIVGDNGRLDFAADGDLRTLDLIESTHWDIGGNDEIFGDLDNDIVIGGAANDVITGADGNDVMLGDNGRIFYQAGAAVTQLGLDPEQESSAELTLTAASAVSTTDDNGRVSSDAVMNVSVTLRDGSIVSKTMTVLKESTFENEDMDDFEFSLVDALFQADLQDLLQVEINDDDKVVFSATDRPVESFEIEAQADNPAVTELGLAAEGQVSASGPHMLTAENPARFVGQLSGDATFQVSVNGDPAVTVIVPQSAALDNATVSSLVKDINDALDAAGLGDQVVAGNDGKTITLSASNQLVRTIEVTADAGNPAVTDLGFATTASTGLAVVGESPVRPVLGRLPGGDAQFDLAITSSDEDGEDEDYTATVTLTKTSTDENDSVYDLVDDLNDALDDALANAQDSNGGPADLSGKIVADRDGSRIVLRAVDASVSAFDLTADPNSPSITTLGLDEAQSAEGWPFVSLTGVNDVTPVFGRLTADAVFVVTIDNGTPVTVTVTKASTDENTTPGELVIDVNDALNTAGLSTYVTAETANERLLLRADNSVQTMSVTADSDNPAVKQMGLGTDQRAVNLPLVAENQLSELAGRLIQNAVIEITVTDGDTTTTETAVVLAGDTANNNDVADLAADVDLALARAGLDGLIEAGADDSDQIVLTAKEAGINLIEVRALLQLIDEIVTTDAVATTGGIDTIAGDLGDDIAIGGAVGDIMSGDDGNDVMLGDSAQLIFSNGTIERIRTIDTNNDVGGEDTIEGNANDDVILGGVFGDDLYGDAATPGADDGADVILGDNGQLDVNDIDNIPGTIDLEYIRIKTTDFDLGGADDIFGNAGDDIAMGGSEGDTIIGDNAESTPGSGVFDELEPNPGEDILIGDQGQMDFFNGLVTRIETTDTAEADGGVDTIQGNDLADVILGGVAGDELHGEAELVVVGTEVVIPVGTAGDDVILGDEGRMRYDVGSDEDLFDLTPTSSAKGDGDPTTLDLIETFATGAVSGVGNALGDEDTIFGNDGADITMGGTADDIIYGDFYAQVDTSGNVLQGTMTSAPNPGTDILLGDGGQVTYINEALTLIRTIEPSQGGADTIQGNDLDDIMMGGFDGDWLYGEAPFPDLELVANDGPRGGNDWILGDNGRLDYILATDTVAGRVDVTTVTLDASASTLDRVTTTDPNDGGSDVIRGNAGSDTIIGGTGKDRIWGDTHDDYPVGPDGDDGDDLIFGDHGKIYPTLPTVPGNEHFINNNFFAIDTNFEDDGDDDVMFGNGANDSMLGQQGDDVMFGGTEDDILIGGHNISGTFSQGDGEAAHDELDDMDQSQQDAILSIVLADRDPSDINDINDVMDGGSDEDLMAGDNAIVIRQDDSTSPRYQLLSDSVIYNMVTEDLEGLISVDVGFLPNIDGEAQLKPESDVGYTVTLLDHSFDIEYNGANDYSENPRVFGNDVMAGGSEDDTMFGQLGDDIMQGDGAVELQDNTTAVDFDPSPTADPSFTVPDDQSGSTYFEIVDKVLNADLSNSLYLEWLYFHLSEQSTDGNDYMEGNGGNDRMYGDLGQDDMIGGSSSLFGLETVGLSEGELDPLRPDGADLMYGGAGNPARLVRNAEIDLETGDGAIDADENHGRDADVMLGDNANIYRLVEVTDVAIGATAFLTFNYDQTTAADSSIDPDGYSTDRPIIPRAVELLDYFYSFEFDGENVNAEFSGIGYGDLMFGESGDDIIHGMTGDDVLFGNSDDDDLYGQQGNDWISGGTGEDGILGDDGLIKTSRNGVIVDEIIVGESLYGIDPLHEEQVFLKKKDPVDPLALNAVISSPGEIQRAVINVEGELKKTMDLIAFNLENEGSFPGIPVNDIIYGGLDDDWIHAGDGDDAIMGGEALPFYYEAKTYSEDGILDTDYGFEDVNIFLQTVQNAPINTDPDLTPNPFWFDFAPYNPGDILRYEGNTAADAEDPHGKTKQEFALYDEFFPRRKIMLDEDGEAVAFAADAVYDFLLNFDETEGPDGYPYGADPEAMPTDGDDNIFGDLGNDWIVGGTGRDHMYGGRGDDLLNMDDDHDSGEGGKYGPHDPDPDTLDNRASDEYQAYADITYGGAGRDIMILNTGADRAIDWVGEYNSYIVPFAPFGAFHISRTLQPQVPEFVIALSISDGIDGTIPDGARYVEQKTADVRVDDPADLEFAFRNGEPYGELGMVRQTDFDWFDQTGAPNDPQPGNLQGKREIMRRELFTDVEPPNHSFAKLTGNWSVTSAGVYEAAPMMLGEETVSIYHLNQIQPSYIEILATINADKEKAGSKSNAYIIFDCQSATDFKFAGVDVGIDKIQIGHRTVDGWVVDYQGNMQLTANTDYDLTLVMYGTVATIWVNESQSVSFDFANPLNDGYIGLGTDNAVARFDDWQVQKLPPTLTFQFPVDFEGTSPDPFGQKQGAWVMADGQYVGYGDQTAISTWALDVALWTLLEFQAVIDTDSLGGLVFDHYSSDDFKFVAIDAVSDQVVIGHHTVKGWVIDADVDWTINSGTGYTLGISMLGSSVSVTLDGQAVMGHLFNSILNDGEIGLFSEGGATTFDEVLAQGDDPAYAENLTAAATPDVFEPDSFLTCDALDEIVDEAIERWTDALGIDDALVASLHEVSFRIVDFSDLTLGRAFEDTILIDTDAAGYGWFVDTTPYDDVEFGLDAGDGELAAALGSEAEGRMDLLTVVMHELGHVLGLEDLDPDTHDLMSETLDAGVRKLADDHINADSVEVNEADDLASLVVMDAAINEAEAIAPAPAKHGSSWLTEFLTNGAGKRYNKFDPKDDIKIVVFDDDEEND